MGLSFKTIKLHVKARIHSLIFFFSDKYALNFDRYVCTVIRFTLRTINLSQCKKKKKKKTYVVLGQWTLSFVDLNQHTRLVVRIGGERLRLLGGDGGVSLDEGGHHSSGPSSIPMDSGATSSSSRSWTSLDLSPDRMAAWTAVTQNKNKSEVTDIH